MTDDSSEQPLTALAFAAPAARREALAGGLTGRRATGPTTTARVSSAISGPAAPTNPAQSDRPQRPGRSERLEPQTQPEPEPVPEPQPEPGPKPEPVSEPVAAEPAVARAMTYEAFAEAARKALPVSPATWGWRGWIRRMSGGRISLTPGPGEEAHRAALQRIQAGLGGPRTIVFCNPKGGAGTTTSTLMAAHTLGVHRGGGVVAWDNNETRGTLGSRALRGRHAGTARELLSDLERFEGAAARVGDLGYYLRAQAASHFDVLASDERAEVTGHIADEDVERLHHLFQRFYQLILIDTGNNMRAGNWLAAVDSADLIVITTTMRHDAASSALWMLDALEGAYGHSLKNKTITVVCDPAAHVDAEMRSTVMAACGLRTRAVFPIPFDPALIDGAQINFDRVSERTRSAWLAACAAMVSAL